ncbi:hypothetical protein ACQ4PT_050492 [Festuca glaucescens]
MAAATGGGGGAKAAVAEQIGQAVQSTSNLLQLMEQSSPAQVHLAKLPKNLLAKTSLTKNTEHVLQQLPNVISSWMLLWTVVCKVLLKLRLSRNCYQTWRTPNSNLFCLPLSYRKIRIILSLENLGLTDVFTDAYAPRHQFLTKA